MPDMSTGTQPVFASQPKSKLSTATIVGIVSLLVIVLSAVAGFTFLNSGASLNDATKASNWCNAPAAGTTFGPCSPNGSYDVGGDGVQTHCEESAWRATGGCCNVQVWQQTGVCDPNQSGGGGGGGEGTCTGDDCTGGVGPFCWAQCCQNGQNCQAHPATGICPSGYTCHNPNSGTQCLGIPTDQLGNYGFLHKCAGLNAHQVYSNGCNTSNPEFVQGFDSTYKCGLQQFDKCDGTGQSMWDYTGCTSSNPPPVEPPPGGGGGGTNPPPPTPKQVSGRVYCADNEGTPDAGTGKVPIVVVDSGSNVLATIKTTNLWNSPTNGTYGPLSILPQVGDQFAVRIAKGARGTAPATDPAFLGAGNALCNNGLTKHEACPFVSMPALQGEFNFVTTVKPTGVAGACVANSNNLTVSWNMPTDTAGTLIRNFVVRLDKDDAPAGFNQPATEWNPNPITQGGNPNDYFLTLGLDHTALGTVCNATTRQCQFNTQALSALPAPYNKPWNPGTYSIKVTALSNYSAGSTGVPAADVYEDVVELCSATSQVTTCTNTPLVCGSQGCATDANCATGLQCVTATNGQKYCSRPEYASACQTNPSATSCCEAPAQPISCLNKKMYKDAAMTQEVGATERLTVGQTVYFAVTLSVPSGATGQVTVTDVLQNGLEYLSSSEGCTYAAATRTITCTGPATTTRYSVAVRVTAAVGSQVSNTATVVHGSNTTTCAVERPVLIQGPMCVNLTRDVAVPKLGDQVRFTCSATEVTANTRFEFRAYLGTQQLDVNLNPSGNAALSLPLQISQLGTYRVQCRVCTMNGTQRSCENWLPAPTASIGTVSDSVDTQPDIHIDIDQDTSGNTNQNTDSSVNMGTNQNVNVQNN